MIGITIDTSSFEGLLNVSQKDVEDLMDYTVKEITARFAQEWEKEAMNSLGSSRQQYISNLIVVDEGVAKGAVVLTGFLPNAIEQGASSWDMKSALLNGPNAKTDDKGVRYNTVPFSWGTPGALEENFNGGIMPGEVYEIVKEKPMSTNSNGISTTQPLVKDELPKKFQAPQSKMVKLPGSKTFKEYQHKASVYEGITKVKDPVTKQNRYISFRRVSENSDPASWIHPGFEAANLAEKALANFNIPSEMGKILDAWVSRL